MTSALKKVLLCTTAGITFCTVFTPDAAQAATRAPTIHPYTFADPTFLDGSNSDYPLSMRCEMARGSLQDRKTELDMNNALFERFIGKPAEFFKGKDVLPEAVDLWLQDLAFSAKIHKVSNYCPNVLSVPTRGSYEETIRNAAKEVMDSAKTKGCAYAMGEADRLLDTVLQDYVNYKGPQAKVWNQNGYRSAMMAYAAVHDKCDGPNWLDTMKKKRNDPAFVDQLAKRLQWRLAMPTR